MERQRHRVTTFLPIAFVLSLGVGVHALSFAAAYAALWRPLPVRDTDRLVVIGESRGPKYSQPLHYLRFLEWRSSATAFEHLSVNHYAQAFVEARERSEQVPLEYVSAGLFQALRTPVLGREFLPDEDSDRGAPVVMLGRELWTRILAADPTTIGRPITINGRSMKLVGVVPPGFRVWRRADVYLPGALLNADVACGTCGNLYVLGRLRPGVTLAAAQREMDAVNARLVGPGSEYTVAVRSYREFVTARARRLLVAALLATGLMLLLACVHAANLLRVSAFSAIGTLEQPTGRPRTRRPAAVDLLLTGGAAAVLGFAFCAAGSTLLTSDVIDALWLPIGAVRADWLVLAYSCGAALFAVLAATLFADLATGASRRAAAETAPGLQPSAFARPLRVTNALLTLQLAGAVWFAFSAGVQARNFYWHVRSDRGFDETHLLTLRVRRLPPDSSRDERASVTQVLHALEGVPGVVSAASARHVPGEPLPRVTATVAGASGQLQLDAVVQHTSRAYLRTLGLSVVRGRWFTATEDRQSRTVVIDETAVAHFFGSGSPIGKRLLLQSRSDLRLFSPVGYAVIVVVKDTRPLAPGPKAMPQLYLPEAAFGVLAVQTAGDPSRMATIVRQRIAALDPTLIVYDITPYARLEEQRRELPRFVLAVTLGLAVVWVVLAALGFYAAAAVTAAARSRRPLVRTAATGVGAGVALAMLLVGAAIADLSVLAAAATLVAVAVGSAAAVARHLQSHGVGAPAH